MHDMYRDSFDISLLIVIFCVWFFHSLSFESKLWFWQSLKWIHFFYHQIKNKNSWHYFHSAKYLKWSSLNAMTDDYLVGFWMECNDTFSLIIFKIHNFTTKFHLMNTFNFFMSVIRRVGTLHEYYSSCSELFFEILMKWVAQKKNVIQKNSAEKLSRSTWCQIKLFVIK